MTGADLLPQRLPNTPPKPDGADSGAVNGSAISVAAANPAGGPQSSPNESALNHRTEEQKQKQLPTGSSSQPPATPTSAVTDVERSGACAGEMHTQDKALLDEAVHQWASSTSIDLQRPAALPQKNPNFDAEEAKHEEPSTPKRPPRDVEPEGGDDSGCQGSEDSDRDGGTLHVNQVVQRPTSNPNSPAMRLYAVDSERRSSSNPSSPNSSPKVDQSQPELPDDVSATNIAGGSSHNLGLENLSSADAAPAASLQRTSDSVSPRPPSALIPMSDSNGKWDPAISPESVQCTPEVADQAKHDTEDSPLLRFEMEASASPARLDSMANACSDQPRQEPFVEEMQETQREPQTTEGKQEAQEAQGVQEEEQAADPTTGTEPTAPLPSGPPSIP
eukprot:SAG31_NODE_6514_length_1990_cov_6.220518_1_plen_389_part_10